MSFNRVLNQIRNNTETETIVYMEGDLVRTTHSKHKRAKQVFTQPWRFTVVGTYTYKVAGVALAEDLALFGID